MMSEVYEALIAAGAPEDKAKAAAEAIPVSDLLATREDIADLRAATQQDIARPENRWTKLELAAYGVGATDLALLIKLAFFS